MDVKKQEAWKLLYSDFSGAERSAVEFLSREAGRFLIRQQGVYTLYVLPVEPEGSTIPHSAIIVGTYDESVCIRSHVKKDEIPENGFLIRAVRNPEAEEGVLLLVTALRKEALFFGAAALIDRMIPEHSPGGGGQVYADRFFDRDPPEFSLSSAPRTKTRGVFAWGHPINDYRRYLEDLARQGLNRVILWNDYRPLNAPEIVDCAHRYGIEVVWGYSWGWIAGSDRISDISPARLAELRRQVLQTFETRYTDCGDGIYFQSFTERADDTIGGRSIADTVTQFVNETAGELLCRHPDLRIQFGLHATSVSRRLDAIASVDRRVEITWEDGGSFPFSRGAVREPGTDDETYEREFQNTVRFTRQILSLRDKDAPTGIVFKGFAFLDWQRFAYQRGPFLLGENVPELTAHDHRLRSSVWRALSAEWVKNGVYARRLADLIVRERGGDVGLYMAGVFDGGVYLPEAVCADLFWDPFRPYPDIVSEALRKPNVRID